MPFEIQLLKPENKARLDLDATIKRYEKMILERAMVPRHLLDSRDELGSYIAQVTRPTPAENEVL